MIISANKKTVVFRIFICLLIIAWCFLIFSMSNETADLSGKRSEGLVVQFIKAFLSIFGIDPNDKAIVDSIEVLFRKSAHMFLFCVLAILSSLLAYTYPIRIVFRDISAFVFSYVYASFDEIHQLYVKGRSGSIKDVLIDSVGILIGILIVRSLSYIISRKRRLTK